MPVRPWWVRWVSGVALLILAAVAVVWGLGGTRTVSALPECPEGGDWTTHFRTALGAAGFSQLAPGGQINLAVATTDIPEFNDCQQFIREDESGVRFISLFAIFARTIGGEDSITTVKNDTNALGFPAAVIYAFDSSYAHLGIEKDFNCLYFYGKIGANPPAYEARIVPVGLDQKRCGQHAPRGVGTLLDVREVQMQKASGDEYPLVARWDWDPDNKVQYLGVKCGDAWCEVGRAVGATPFGASPSYSRPEATVALRRVVEVKGWYDEQRLAIPAPNATNSLPVSDIVGTFIPHPGLGTANGPPNGSPFQGNWMPVATVAISGPPGVYKSKLNLDQSAVRDQSSNAVFLCYAPAAAGPGPCFAQDPTMKPTCASTVTGDWWAKVVSATGRTKYFCVVRREHPGAGVNFPRIPGIVRWRWALNDETMWIRCLSGCCEVQAGDE